MKFRLFKALFTGIIFYSFSSLSAEILTFHAGDTASYTFNQQAVFKGNSLVEDDDIHYFENKNSMDCDITLLSKSETPSGFPYEVEIIIKKIAVSEIQFTSFGVRLWDYYSGKPQQTENLAVFYEQILERPLTFTVNGPFDIKERGNFLTDLEENFDSPIYSDVVSIQLLNIVLTQIFHLAGEDLKVSNQFNVDCFPLLSLDDEDIREETALKQLCTYTINSAQEKQVGACLVGSVKSNSNELNAISKEKIFFVGDVTWDILNPLRQTRNVSFLRKSKTYEPENTHATILVEQQWILR
jgi:hypothetical protein